MNRFLKTTIIAGITFLASMNLALPQQADDKTDSGRVMFVLDGSGSMWGQIDGTHKITIAKQVMSDLITNWDQRVPMGLMSYGHRRKGDCKDIETLALPGPVNRKKMIAQVQSINPKGKTPITDSISLAAASTGVYGGQKSTVVLVSDGLETCDADPCAFARFLKQQNAKFVTHVIGFDVTEEEFSGLQCIASETGGKFLRANNASELKDAIAQTVAAVQGNDSSSNTADGGAPGSDGGGTQTAALNPSKLYAKLCETCERLDPLDAFWTVQKNGKTIYDGVGATTVSTPPFTQGRYQVTANLANTVVVMSGEVEFGDDGKQIGELNLNAGSVKLFAYATDEKTASQGAFFTVFPLIDGKPQKQIEQTGIKDHKIWLPAGKYKVTAKHQNIEESAEIEIVAGQETIHEFDLRIGHIKPDVVLFEGGQINRDMLYRLLDAETGKELATKNGSANEPMAARPGKYDLLVQHVPRGVIGRADIKFPVEIKAGETISGPYVLNVGRFEYSISSKSGQPIGGIWLHRVNDDGSTREIAFTGEKKFSGVAPAGKYSFTVQVGDKRPKTGVFEVVPGEVRELTIEFP